MSSRDRRLGFRVPLKIFLNQYVLDRPLRAMTTNVSDTGIFLQTVKITNHSVPAEGTPIGLEFELPGTGETIWARGEICYEADDSMVRSAGIRFTAMPRIYARMLRDFCIEARRSQLGTLLERIRHPAAIAA